MIKLPYLTRNGHLGHYAAQKNPNYFIANQLYDLRKDPEEKSNLYSEGDERMPQLTKQLKQKLLIFSNRPYGEFVR